MEVYPFFQFVVITKYAVANKGEMMYQYAYKKVNLIIAICDITLHYLS